MKVHIDNEEWAGCVQETVDLLFRKVLKRKKPKIVEVLQRYASDEKRFG